MDLLEYYSLKNFMSTFSTSLIDSVDKMNFVYTIGILVFFCNTILLRCVVFHPILCWVPYEFPRVWETYVNSFCWIQPKFILQQNGSYPRNDMKKSSEQNYYQWVSIVLLLQIIISRAPMELWKLLSTRIGLDIRSRTSHINDEIECESEAKEKFDHFAQLLVDMLLEKFNLNSVFSTEIVNSMGKSFIEYNDKKRRKPWRFVTDKRNGSVLFTSYMIIKVLAIITIVFQIYVMQSFLGDIGWGYGLGIVRNLSLHGLQHSWRVTGMFPREVGCDVRMRRTGQPVTYSVRCVLPGNMLNEKVYLILWFWFLLCGIFSFGNIFLWLYRMLPRKRIKFISDLLEVHSSIEEISDKPAQHEITSFVNSFLHNDGVLIAHMLTAHCKMIVASRILGEMFRNYKIRMENLKNNQIF